MEIIREWFIHGARLFTLLGFSIVGALSTARFAYVWIRRRILRQKDSKVLGAEYRTWRRLAEQSGVLEAGRSLTRQIAATEEELAGDVLRALRAEIEDRLDRQASGTLELTNRDLIENGLLIPAKLEGPSGDIIVSIESGVDVWAVREGAAGALVIGPPGAGKSILCRTAEHAWLTSRTAGLDWLITLDWMDFLGESNSGRTFGSREWLAGVIEKRLFNGALSTFERRALAELIEVRAVIMIDALDEIASRLQPSEMHRLLTSWVFRHAVLCTARVSYYEAALLGAPAVREHRVFAWREPAEIELQSFVGALCRRIYPAAEAEARTRVALTIRDNAPDLRELTHNPLLLAMCASIRWPDADTAELDVSLVYREFVRLSLSREHREGRLAVASDLVVAALAEFAWLHFCGSQGRLSGRGLIMAAVQNVTEIPEQQRIRVADAIESCPMLTLRRSSLADPDEYDARFYHQSFEDYLVARRADAWLRERSTRGEDYFEYIDTPEVTFFLKEAIVRISREPAARRTASVRLRDAFSGALNDVKEASDERTARLRKFAAGQVGYYLGMFGEADLQMWLARILEDEHDFWIKRAGVIGLAFGGKPELFHRFINATRRGIDDGDFSLARKNIGVELGFYGDQVFDPLDPAVDMGGDSCTRLVGRSVLELRMGVEAANWRMVLFNLLYLAKYRAVSHQSFLREIGPRLQELSEAVGILASDAEKARYPEVAEIGELISTLRPASTSAR